MGISLWDFQAASVEALRENIRAGIKNQLLSAPTGSGKTEVASYLLDECHRKGKRAVFVCDRVALCDQTSERLDRYGIPHGVIQADHWRYRPWERIQVASALTLAQRGWPDAHLIVVDEAHTMVQSTLTHIAARQATTIGLTATPFARGLGKHYDATVSVTTTNALIESGTLARYRIFAASEPDMTGARVSAGEWTKDEAARRSMPVIGDCVAEYLKHGRDRKFICFGVNVAHCEELQRQFMAAGVHCALYTYRTGDAERGPMVEEFRKPDSYIRGLISVSALAKGFDVSDVGVVILARPLRSSLAEHVQMFGRGLRSHPGKEEVTVLCHSGNCLRFWDDMQDFFENGASTLDDGERREKPAKEKKEPRATKCPECHHIHKAAPHCPSCGYTYTRRSTVAHVAGELAELGRGGSASRQEKQRFYSELLGYAQEKGWSRGWAGHRYHERFGVWPRSLEDISTTPTPETRRWILSRTIARARGRRAA